MSNLKFGLTIILFALGMGALVLMTMDAVADDSIERSELYLNSKKFNLEFDERLICHIVRAMNDTKEVIQPHHMEIYIAIGRYICINRFGMKNGCVVVIKKVQPFNLDPNGKVQFMIKCGPSKPKREAI